MKIPKLANGYTRIANEIMDELSKIRIPGRARQVLDFILRKTYGWHKKTATISLSQFTEGTGMSKISVCKGLNKLLDMNLITKKGNAKSYFTKKGNDYDITYGLQKEYNRWNCVTLPKKVMTPTLPKKETLRYQKRKSTLPKKVTPPLKDKSNKDKERYTKDFLAFYQKYPIKKSKSKAFESWNKLKKSNNLPDLPVILTAIDQQTKEKEIKISAGKFCPEWKHPSTWLNQKCWEDEVDLRKTEINDSSNVDIYGDE